MKTNLSSLMNVVSEEEREFAEYVCNVNEYAYNTSIQELDGRTIQEAIVDNTNLRKMKSLYSSLLNKRNSKRRVTEVNNSYFESKILNYDIDKIKNESELIERVAIFLIFNIGV